MFSAPLVYPDLYAMPVDYSTGYNNTVSDRHYQDQVCFNQEVNNRASSEGLKSIQAQYNIERDLFQKKIEFDSEF